MISADVRDRILVQLQNRVDTLTQEWHCGSSDYHFCHPIQNQIRKEKQKEIDDCNDLMKTLQELDLE